VKRKRAGNVSALSSGASRLLTIADEVKLSRRLAERESE